MKKICTSLALGFLLGSSLSASTPLFPTTLEELRSFGEDPRFQGVIDIYTETEGGVNQCTAAELSHEGGYRLLLTAAHCLKKPFSIYRSLNDLVKKRNSADAFFMHPYYEQTLGSPYDFGAVLFYTKSKPQFPGYPAYRGSPDSLAHKVLFSVGYGRQENGETPKHGFQVIPHSIFNVTLAQHGYVPPELLKNPRMPYGVPTQGDSGGPLFVGESGTLSLAGVAIKNKDNGEAASSFKWFIFPDYLEDWVVSVFSKGKKKQGLQDFGPQAKEALLKRLGISWHQVAADLKNNPLVQFSTGYLMINDASASSPQKGLELIRKSGDAGYGEALEVLMSLYFEGRAGLVAQSYETARKFGEKATKGGAIRAMSTLAYLYRKGLGGKQHIEKARKLVETAAAAGYPHAYHQMGVMYLTGDGYPRDPVEGRKLIEKAAERGYLPAQKSLSMLDRDL